MPARTTCRACGGTIEITPEGSRDHIVAIADRFFHRGCIEVPPDEPGPTGPVYLIPRGW